MALATMFLMMTIIVIFGMTDNQTGTILANKDYIVSIE